MSAASAPRVRDLRLVALGAGAWGSALLCVFFEQAAGIFALVLWTGGLALAASLWHDRSRMPRHGALGLVSVVLVVGAGVASTVAFATPAREDVRTHDGFVVEVTADITSALRVGRDGRLWFDAQTASVAPPGQWAPVAATVRIGIEVPEDGAPEAWEMGARIRVIGQAKASEAGERAALVVFGRGEVTTARAPTAIFALAGEVRRQFVERALRFPEPGAGLLPGLAVGDTRAVGESLNQAMLTSGLSHLTAVSGANCAIVVGAVYGIVALCRGGRGLRILLAAIALMAFVILVTPEPSVIRAATMAGLGMLTLLLGRPAAGVGVLSLAAAVILIADPWLAATPGFALSAAATAALIVLARPVARGLAQWMPEPIALGVAVPLSAQLVCGPILALFAEQQSIVGVAANMIAAPAAPVATVIGLLACLALPIPPLADLFAASAWLPAAWIATTAEVSAALPGAQMLITPGVGSALIVAVLTVAVTLLLVRGRYGSRPAARWRRLSVLALAIAVGLGGGRMLLGGPLATMASPADWSIAACDVGQGDAVVLRSEGRVALIDTGPEPVLLRPCLRALGIDRIDLLVLTHFDLDHYGGWEAVLGRVGTVLHGPAGDRRDEKMLGELEAAGARIVEGFAGQHGTLGDARWQVLWPVRDSRAVEIGNDTSLVLEFAGGELPRSLFLGDLGASSQRRLLAGGRIRGPYAVVKVAHHGSRDQEPALYAAARPAIALFTVGENGYGHPHPDALAMVDGARILRTDQQGRVLLRSEEESMTIWTER